MSAFIESTAGTAVLTVLVALVTSGVLLGLLKLGPDRRKISADAELSHANAASVLTGAALEMVQNAEHRAERAERSAARAWRRVHVLENSMRHQGITVPPDEEEIEDEPRSIPAD